jgi:protein-S-isoprenylcysteine O-methyltransferase Ste14
MSKFSLWQAAMTEIFGSGNRVETPLLSKERNKRLLQRIRVPLGFVLAIALVVLARPAAVTLAIGGAIALLGLLTRAWAAGHIRKFEKLATTGPYSHTRNPLYFGSFLLAAGFAVAGGVWWLAAVVAVLYLCIYYPVMRVEEGDLRSRFGTEFEEFAANVPLFFPRITSWNKEPAGFDFQLYLSHREYQAAIGATVAFALLAAKMFFFNYQ